MCKNILDAYEFDEQFELLMNRSIEKLENDRDREEQFECRSTRAFVFQLGRSLVLRFAEFCRIDPYGGRPPQMITETHGGNRTMGSKRADGSKWHWFGRHWPRIFLILYIHCSIRSSIRIYFQYAHDVHKLSHNRLTKSKARNSAISAQVSGYRTQSNITLEAESRLLHEYEAPLRSLGAPYRELTFGIEFLDVFLVIMAFALYLQSQLYFKHFCRFDYSIIRCLLDLPSELRTCNTIIRNEMNRFVESSRQYTRMSLQLIADSEAFRNLLMPAQRHEQNLLDLRQQRCQFDMEDAREYQFVSFHSSDQTSVVARLASHQLHSLSAIAPRPEIARGRTNKGQRGRASSYHQLVVRSKILDYFYTIKLVENMALSGSLMPCNRSIAWINRITRYNAFTCILFLVYCLLISMLVLYEIPNVAEIKFYSDSMDLLALAEMATLMFIVIITSLFYGYLVLTSSLDQVYLVEQLKRNIRDTIVINTRRYSLSSKLLKLIGDTTSQLMGNANSRRALKQHRLELVRQYSLLVETNYTQMNADLLNVLLQYKIYVAQFTPIRRSYRFVTLVSASLMVLIPLIGRVHVPYVDAKIKYYMGTLNLLCVIVADVACLVPISYMYTRSIELYKLLSSLLAHTVAVSVDRTSGAIQKRAARFSKWESNHTGHHHHHNHNRLHLEPEPVDDLRRIYNGHAIWLLRKELNHPDCLVTQFVTSVLGVRLNYSNLLKVHFWVGLIIQSIFFETTALSREQEFLGSIMLDPLGLF